MGQIGFEAKYIVIDRFKDPIEGNTVRGETMIIFPYWIQHSSLATMLGAKDHVVSAGSVVVDEGTVKCFGESVSLFVQARPELDSKLARRLLCPEE